MKKNISDKQIQLMQDTEDCALIISNNGDMVMLEPPYEGDTPDHVWLVDGIRKALCSEVLHEVLRDVITKAHKEEPDDEIMH